MALLPLTIACWDYDRTRPLLDGRVTVEGCDATFLTMPIEEMFIRALTHGEFDVSELSFSNFMAQCDRGENAYTLIPVFPSRSFRHSAFFIRTDRGIVRPEDLKGRLVGVREYTMTAAVVARGILADEYGIRAEDIRWCMGDVDVRERDRIDAPTLARDIDVTVAPDGKFLDSMLRVGEIDALLAYKPPPCFVDNAPNVGRLFPDYVRDEKAYFKKTGIFPIMHPVGVKTGLLHQHPWLSANLYAAFDKAKAIAMEDLRAVQALKIALPWLADAVGDTVAIMGPDFWPYGIEPNRSALDALTRQAHAQGVTARRLTLKEMFAAEG
jgi:4,5-dihydroxyphthalate decarboxylase